MAYFALVESDAGASQTRKEAVADAVEVRGFDEDHVSILSSRAALTADKKILDQAPR